MTTFQSKITINRPVAEVYAFLADMNNHQQLMPDSISEWSSTVDEASFNIQNMVKLSLKVDSRTPDKLITIIPAAKPPFDMNLTWALSGDDKETTVTYTISADLNMMMKMMASGPLQKLADHETSSLAAAVK
ncbi:MAG: SRPBCC family protein [Sphingobacteriaceae bacterium]|nr:MAG: SRPBCC family protein [Sphingobacteriaceae bacterium]